MGIIYYQEKLINFVKNLRTHGFVAALYADFDTMFLFFLCFFLLVLNIALLLGLSNGRFGFNEDFFEPREKRIKKNWKYLQKLCFWLDDTIIKYFKSFDIFETFLIPIASVSSLIFSTLLWNYLPFTLEYGFDTSRLSILWFDVYPILLHYFLLKLWLKSFRLKSFFFEENKYKRNSRLLNLFLDYTADKSKNLIVVFKFLVSYMPQIIFFFILIVFFKHSFTDYVTLEFILKCIFIASSFFELYFDKKVKFFKIPRYFLRSIFILEILILVFSISVFVAEVNFWL